MIRSYFLYENLNLFFAIAYLSCCSLGFNGLQKDDLYLYLKRTLEMPGGPNGTLRMISSVTGNDRSYSIVLRGNSFSISNQDTHEQYTFTR
jgi:hypothetical protein